MNEIKITRALRIGSKLNGSTQGSIIFVDSSGNLAQDNSNLFYDNTNNRLGIGTDSPQVAFHIVNGALRSTASESPLGFVVEDTNGKVASLTAGDANAVFLYDKTGGFSIQARDRADVLNGTGNANDTKLIVLGGGNVGIGTKTPVSKLHINTGATTNIGQIIKGVASQSADYFNINSSTGSGGEIFTVQADGNVGIGTDSPTNALEVVGVTKTNVIQAIQTGSNNASALIESGSTGDRADFILKGHNTSHNGDYATFTMRTDLADYVSSIYDASEDTFHQLYQFDYLNDLIKFGSNTLRSETGAYASISTQQPFWLFHGDDSDAVGESFVGSTFAFRSTVSEAVGKQARFMGVRETNYAGKVGAAIFTSPDGSTTAERMRIDGDGNVGIGTTTPSEKLQVSGNVMTTADNDKYYAGAGKDMSIYYDGTSGNIKTDEVAPSDLLISCGTDKTLELQEVVYDDVNSAFDIAKVPAANNPTWSNFQGNLNAYTFGLNDYLEITSELFHKYKEGSDLDLHVHWVTNGLDGADRTVKWEIEYTIANMDSSDGVGDAFPSTIVITAETTIPADTPDLTHMYTPFTAITGTGFKIGAYIKARVRRIASTGTEPTVDPFGFALGMHYQVNTLGSRLLADK